MTDRLKLLFLDDRTLALFFIISIAFATRIADGVDHMHYRDIFIRWIGTHFLGAVFSVQLFTIFVLKNHF